MTLAYAFVIIFLSIYFRGYGGKVLIEVNNSTLYIGSRLIISCITDKDNLHNLQIRHRRPGKPWQRLAHKCTPYSSTYIGKLEKMTCDCSEEAEKVFSVVVRNVQSDASGTWKCEYVDRSGTEKNETTVKVVPKPAVIWTTSAEVRTGNMLTTPAVIVLIACCGIFLISIIVTSALLVRNRKTTQNLLRLQTRLVVRADGQAVTENVYAAPGGSVDSGHVYGTSCESEYARIDNELIYAGLTEQGASAAPPTTTFCEYMEMRDEELKPTWQPATCSLPPLNDSCMNKYYPPFK